MHSAYAWGLSPTRHHIYTYLGATPPRGVSTYKDGLFDDPRKHTVFRLPLCLYHLLRVQEYTTFLEYLDLGIVESSGSQHDLVELSFGQVRKQHHRKASYPILVGHCQETFRNDVQIDLLMMNLDSRQSCPSSVNHLPVDKL